MNKVIYIFFLFVSILGLTSSIAQKRSDLEQIKREKLAEIEKLNDLLKQTSDNKEYSVSKIALLNRKIEVRRELINDLNNQIVNIGDKIDILIIDIEKRNSQIYILKTEYSKIVYSSYYHFKSFKQLLFIAASNNFNQAYRRINYLKQYTTHRKNLLKNISFEIDILEKKIAELKESKEQKTILLVDRENETKELEVDKTQQKKLEVHYSSMEKKLKKELLELQEATKKIEREIERVIREEAIAKAKRSKKVIKEDLQITTNFGENKRQLPWPVKNGSVVSYFGEHEHPVFKGIMVKNNGIDISTKCNSDVYAVFDGVVSKIFAIKGANFAVIIRHGDYLTVYQNIQNIDVKVGEKVSLNQVIAKSYCINDENISNVHFEIWNELKKMNPLEWLKR
jgi:murein hydrolase activator